MVGLDSSAAIWTRLSTYYASHTRATIKKLCLLLRTPKNDRMVTNYLLDIKKTVDSLSVIGASISNAEHIDAILDGLSEEYDGFIIVVLSLLIPARLTNWNLYSWLKKKCLRNINSLKIPSFKPIRFPRNGFHLVPPTTLIFTPNLTAVVIIRVVHRIHPLCLFLFWTATYLSFSFPSSYTLKLQ